MIIAHSSLRLPWLSSPRENSTESKVARLQAARLRRERQHVWAVLATLACVAHRQCKEVIVHRRRRNTSAKLTISLMVGVDARLPASLTCLHLVSFQCLASLQIPSWSPCRSHF